MLQKMTETWRAEIADDLDAANAALETELAALTVAEADVTAAKRERRELAEAIGRLGKQPTLSNALMFRVREHEDRLVQVDGRLVQARNAIKSTRARIRDLEEALAQIAVMSPIVTLESAA